MKINIFNKQYRRIIMKFRYYVISLLLGIFIGLLIIPNIQQTKANISVDTLKVKGLSSPVEIIKDYWGISHIYAKNQKDLFFAQGFNAARDRLFQFEIWRRQAAGTMAEVLGRRAIKRDIGARLLKARVDMKQEMNHYHPQGEEIISSFVRGINAYIELTEQNPNLLPIEFRILGIKPGNWTPEIVVSRHNGLYRNVNNEIRMAQRVNVMGAEKVKSLLNLHPGDPQLEVVEGIDLSLISNNVLELYKALRSRVSFTPEDIVDPSVQDGAFLDNSFDSDSLSLLDISQEMNIGSNNWVITGKRTLSGCPVMANDPHRSIQVPSLRYWVHLVAPGWNVIGGGEPALPGVSIGHNEYGAWGLTIFAIDQEDLYVYDTNPRNPKQYRYKGKWEDMEVIQEKIIVKGAPSVAVDLKFTRHGPILYEDKEHNKAYALRAGWLEIGGAPYLASLRMDQAKNWEEFRDACSFFRTPSENMVWADIEGNIGWQAVGITPLRRNWTGLMPVAGDGRFEWDGFLPIKALPNCVNPPEGFIATANQNNIPPDYPYALGYNWADPCRFARICEFLSSGRKMTMMDMMNLQQDVLSIPARCLVPLLKGLKSGSPKVQKALDMLMSWDYIMDKNSIEAGIYMSWQKRLSKNVWNLYIPEEGRTLFRGGSIEKMIDWVTAPDGHFGENPTDMRDSLLIRSLEEGVNDLINRLGPDMQKWHYGQEKYCHIKVRHILSNVVNPELRDKFDVGPLPLGGNKHTVNHISSGKNQKYGASFRIIADVGNWDNSLGTNTPGQSGDPSSPHYNDLFEMWSEGKYFPVLYSREKIELSAEAITILNIDR